MFIFINNCKKTCFLNKCKDFFVPGCNLSGWRNEEELPGERETVKKGMILDWFAFYARPYTHFGGRDSSVDIATCYGQDGPGIDFRWGARFSAPFQTGPGAHLASCTMGTESFRGVKSGLGVTLLVPWSWKGRAIPPLPLWAVRPVQSLSSCTGVHFTF